MHKENKNIIEYPNEWFPRDTSEIVFLVFQNHTRHICPAGEDQAGSWEALAAGGALVSRELRAADDPRGAKASFCGSRHPGKAS